MRLVGVSFDLHRGNRPTGPLGRGFLPMSQLTALIGQNDSGKSHVLRLVHSALAGRPVRMADEAGLVFFAECTTEEFEAIASHALADLAGEIFDRSSPSGAVIPGERDSW